jgi:hypothetical protein
VKATLTQAQLLTVCQALARAGVRPPVGAVVAEVPEFVVDAPKPGQRRRADLVCLARGAVLGLVAGLIIFSITLIFLKP